MMKNKEDISIITYIKQHVFLIIAILVAVVCSVLFIPAVQNCFIRFGESILGRTLRDYEKWHRKITQVGILGIFADIGAVLLYVSNKFFTIILPSKAADASKSIELIETKNRISGLLFSMLSSASIFILFCFTPFNGKVWHGFNLNMLFFACLICYFFSIAIMTCTYIKVSEKLLPVLSALCVVFLVFSIIAHYHYGFLLLQPVLKGLSKEVSSVILTCLFFVIFINIKVEYRVPAWVIIPAIAACSVFSFLHAYTPNPFLDAYGTYWHYFAYTVSPLNAFSGKAYAPYNMGQYGHYAIFYKILSMPFRSDFSVLNVLISLTSLACVLFISFALYKSIENSKLKFLGVVAINCFWAVCPNGVYLMSFPHRIIFYAISFFLISCYKRLTFKLFNALMIIVGSLAILWNIEFGLCCIILLVSFNIFMDYFGFYHEVTLKNVIFYFQKRLAFVIIEILMMFMLAWLILNVYNISMGGNFQSFTDLLFPLLSNQFKVNDMILPFGSLGYKTPMFIVIIVSSFAISYVAFFRFIEKRDWKNALLLSNSIFCIFSSTYYVNRAYYGNLSVSYLPFIISIILLSDQIKTEHNIRLKKFFIAIISFFAFSAIVTAPYMLKTKINTSFQSETLNELCDEVKLKVPEGMPAFGYGTTLIYNKINRDKYFYTNDFAWIDFTPHTQEYYKNELLKCDAFFAEDSCAERACGELISNYQKELVVEKFGLKYSIYRNIQMEDMDTIFDNTEDVIIQ